MSFFAIAVALLSFLSTSAFAKDIQVFILHSYHQEYPWTKGQNEGFVTQLQTDLNSNRVHFSTEYLDTKRLKPNRKFYAEYATYLKARFTTYQPQAIYLTDDNAMSFWLEHGQSIFPEAAVFFSGINRINQEQRHQQRGFQGVYEQLPLSHTLKLVKALKKPNEPVIFLGDGSSTHQAMIARIESTLNLDRTGLNYQFLGSPQLEDLLTSLSKEQRALLVFTTIGGVVNKQGNPLSPAAVAKAISEIGDYRIITMEDTFLVDNVLGGVVNISEAQGRAAAKILEHALGFVEEEAQKQPKLLEPIPAFNYRQLKKHKVANSLLPTGHILYNEPTNFFYQNKNEVLLAILIIALQTAIIFLLLRNIRRRHQAERATRESEARFRNLIDFAPDAIFLCDKEGHIIDVNKQACTFLGYEKDELKRLKVWDIDHTQNAKRFAKLINRLEHSAIQSMESVQMHKDGKKLPVEISLTWLNMEKVPLLLATARDITERKEAEKELKQKEERLNFLAYHDPLTNLPNRLLFFDRLDQVMTLAHRNNEKVALLYFDLDRFKNINDTLGHDVGDRLLCQVADRLRACTRGSDTVARMGGDEFVVIISEMQKPEQVIRVAQKILQLVPTPIELNEKELFITTSIGVSVFPDDAYDAEGLLRCADIAMYRAKDSGRNTFQFYRPEMSARVSEMLYLEGHLRHALEQEQFVLYYQPQFDLLTGDLVGLEALIRWQHPERGMVPPADFIPLAEETGLIVPMGEWVLHEACRQRMIWEHQGILQVPIAVNLSPRQLLSAELKPSIERALAQGLQPEWLELEITETMLMQNRLTAEKVLKDFEKMGIRLAIDDFGSGYSSLAYLRHFPLDRLKIDRVFIREMTRDTADFAIARTIIELTKGLGLEAVAEGIETVEQAEILQSMGCNIGQGFLYSPPRSADDLVEHYCQESRKPTEENSPQFMPDKPITTG